MAHQSAECPKCGHQNDHSDTACAACGIGLKWALEHWDEYVEGEQGSHIPLILVSDFDPANHELLSLILKRAGYRVTLVSTTATTDVGDALETIRLAECLRPDLIITDVTKNKGSLDGYELIRRLKANPATKLIPVIVLTARVHPSDIDLAMKLGAALYLTKPFQIADVLNAVQSAIFEEDRD